jgi:hypothetical protein
METLSVNKAIIDAEYQRLGHSIGWRFLTSPEKNIFSSRIALVTQNPGGNLDDPNAPRWSVENGNAYTTESWRGLAVGQDPLQIQVKRMFQIIGVDINSILSGYFVPFRSPDWKSLKHPQHSVAFGAALWNYIFAVSPAKIIFAFGKDLTVPLCNILDATSTMSVPAYWGGNTINRYMCSQERTLIILPHLSRFRLFYRPQSESSFKNLIQGINI